MNTLPSDSLKLPKPIRLWPGVTAALFTALSWFGVPLVKPSAMFYGFIGGYVGALVIFLWWLFFSRAPWLDRLGAFVLMTAALLATSKVVDRSIANGMMGMMLYIYSIPVLSLALVGWAAACRRLASGPRRMAMAATILLACGMWMLIRTEGVTGGGTSQLHWRWTKTPEERLLAQTGGMPVVPPAAKSSEMHPPAQTEKAPGETTIAKAPEKEPAASAGDDREPSFPAPAAVLKENVWPGFRGPHRDSRIPGVRIATDWTASPPVELWRRPVGPGWSSFAVRSNLLYTQEQRGNDEVVSCYDAAAGKPVWEHRDAARFWESNGGAGPRATPTLSGNRVCSFGATGILNVLNADSGSLVWSRKVASDTGAKVPYWGLSSSPLVVDDLVVVFAGKLAAYDIATGRPRWFGPVEKESYSSPHLLTLRGVDQIVMLSGDGATSVSPADGKVLWRHILGSSIVQPAQTDDGDLLITATNAGGGTGTRRIAAALRSGAWTVEERWTSTGLKPYFNDFVVHRGHAFGFDGGILACIDLQDGRRKWKGGRYGFGQLLLLSGQDLLIILSEKGELALVAADPDRFAELARFTAIEGKTWNHPVIAGDVLLVRNGEEMAAFRLPLERHRP